MNKDKIILVGGGGHCRSCIDVIETENRFKIAGILDIPEKVGKHVLKYRIIGADKDIPKLVKEYSNFLITLGQIKSANIRVRIFDILKGLGANLPVIISPKTHISVYSSIGQGSIVMHDVILNANAVVGDNCIINSKALIEHDAVVGSNTHISTGAIVNGDCYVGNNCFIGSGVTLANNISIADNVIIGAGSYVAKDIDDQGVYMGYPARKVKG